MLLVVKNKFLEIETWLNSTYVFFLIMYNVIYCAMCTETDTERSQAKPSQPRDQRRTSKCASKWRESLYSHIRSLLYTPAAAAASTQKHTFKTESRERELWTLSVSNWIYHYITHIHTKSQSGILPVLYNTITLSCTNLARQAAFI